MLLRNLLSLCVVSILVTLQFLSTDALFLKKQNRIRIQARGAWEEVTLATESESALLRPLRWLESKIRKRQSGGTTVPNGTSKPQGSAGNLTGPGTTTANSGAAGQIPGGGPIPGQITSTTSPNRDQSNCYDITTTKNNSCWEELNLSDYVRGWINNTICGQGEGFANCFLRQNGFPGLDCGVIGTGAMCPALQNPLVQGDPKQWYVALNIQAINNFFTSWYQAVAGSAPTAEYNVAQIVQIIDVPSTTPVILQDLLIALQSVFALIPGPLGIYAAHTGASFAYQTAAQVLSNALFVVPNVGRYLFPTDSTASQVVQMATLQNNFATVINQVKSNLNQTLVSVMANVTEFLAFAQYGNFSEHPPSVPDDAAYLYYAFNTYIISQALNGNNIYAVVGRDTNVSALYNNGTKTAYDNPDCKKGYNARNICDNFWYSTLYQSTFTLDNFSHMNRGYGKEMNQLLANFTTGPLLFEQAYECSSSGQFGQPVNITVSASGVNTACISQLRVLTWDMSCTPGNGECEFLEQSKQPDFGWSPKGAALNQQFTVPYGYLGPGINDPSRHLNRGPHS